MKHRDARATTAAPASATMPLPETITLLESKRWAASCGPSEKKRPPIDQDESTDLPDTLRARLRCPMRPAMIT